MVNEQQKKIDGWCNCHKKEQGNQQIDIFLEDITGKERRSDKSVPEVKNVLDDGYRAMSV